LLDTYFSIGSSQFISIRASSVTFLKRWCEVPHLKSTTVSSSAEWRNCLGFCIVWFVVWCGFLKRD